MVDKERIEKEAVSAVGIKIRTAELLSDCIPTNDKAPCWDGYILVYKDTEKSKNGIRRVHIQVKGTKKDNIRELDSEEATYSTDINDLNAYREEGGVIFFLVLEYYDDEGNPPRTKIYYQELLPYKIYEILNKKRRKDQKSISIKYKAFPENSNQIMTVFLQFLENRAYQGAFSGNSIPNITDILEKHKEYEVPLTVFSQDTKDPIQAFFRSDCYLYVRSDDIKTLIPVGIAEKNIQTSQIVSSIITVNGYEYYNNVIVIKDKKSTRVKIGFSLILENTGEKIVFKYVPSQYIRQFVQDQLFLQAIVDHGGMEIDGHSITLEEEQIKQIKESMLLPQQILNNFIKIKDMMIKVGCIENSDDSVDINYTKLNDKDYRFLNVLCNGILENKKITGISYSGGPFTCFDIGRKKIVVEITTIEDGYNIEKIDREKWKFATTDSDGNEVEIPLCFIYKKEEFEKCLNIPFADFLQMLKSSPKNKVLYNSANKLVLDMISAFDSTNGMRKKQLFDTIIGITNWLNTIEDKGNEWDTRLSRLNQYQLLKRVRDLNETEKKDIETIIDNSDDSDIIRFGAYLLLDNRRRANVFYNKLDIVDKKEIKKMPIYRFMKKK